MYSFYLEIINTENKVMHYETKEYSLNFFKIAVFLFSEKKKSVSP